MEDLGLYIDKEYKEYIEFKRAEGFVIEERTPADELKKIGIVNDMCEVIWSAPPTLTRDEFFEFIDNEMDARRQARKN